MKGIVLFLFLAALQAFGSTENLGVDAGAALPNASYVSWAENRLISDIQCTGHNGGHEVGVYSVEAFSLEASLEAIKKYDKERGCAARTYSKTPSESLARYRASIQSIDPWVGCLQGDDKDVERYLNLYKDLVENLFDPKETFATISSEMSDSETYSEGCYYYHFYIFRKNGTFLRLTFDHTD